ncbi:hypothetical protein FA13DRAFT_558010 [Coprinellus micaceus]|uniref:Uncharacterized protein n=1 Tax=Coprinellus micaceus TaxID=71717 RepID=A0A4Y7SBU8_COPMI|nr:hypothetical protein FA13DRAFT_558010 [Coprinellus micaceus]
MAKEGVTAPIVGTTSLKNLEDLLASVHNRIGRTKKSSTWRSHTSRRRCLGIGKSLGPELSLALNALCGRVLIVDSSYAFASIVYIYCLSPVSLMLRISFGISVGLFSTAYSVS